MSIERRTFLKQVAAGSAALCVGEGWSLCEAEISSRDIDRAVRPRFLSDEPAWVKTWDAALAVLASNVRLMPGDDHSVLIEGSTYGGVWLECAPLEGLVYGTLQSFVPQRENEPRPLEIARANHFAFFRRQREDGQLPALIRFGPQSAPRAGYGQIQMVVPVAATVWELFKMTQDEELLQVAYACCSCWDAWLRRYRDTRGTGLCEGFCTYDTGMDNSPRWAGMPNACPGGDARRCADDPTLPRLCPDLSATVFGGRVALAKMARALGKHDDEARWLADAEKIRRLILAKLYSPEDGAFYDLDAKNNFVRVHSDVITRVLGEHVVDTTHDKAIFESVWTKQLHNATAFWAPYPFPSVAMDDPSSVRPIPRNSWGGASQALTALRAPRWMTHYGKHAELEAVMRQWCMAIMRSGAFCQQMDPLTGEFTLPDPGGYSPCALVFLEFARALEPSAKSNRKRG